MATKIILTIEEGLTRQEQDDLRYLFADALGEFATKRTPARDYVENRYPEQPDADVKTVQVERRIQLARKLHNASLGYELEHATPHQPTPVMDYYKTCDEDDLAAMTALLDFLPAAQFGERKGWMVLRDSGILVVEGPDEQRAFWLEVSDRWMWLEEGERPKQATVQ